MPDTQLRRLPVSAWKQGEDIYSTGISFEDYARMNTKQRKQSGERRLPTPSWATNNAKFQELLVNFLEERARISPRRRTGTLKERLELAQKRIIASCAKLQATLDKLCAEYVEIKRRATVADRSWLRKREVAIESIDTRLRFERKDGGAAMVAAVVYLYYRLSLDSVGVGAELGIKPPHVRQILWRLHQTAASIGRRDRIRE